jgi:hypothetical protein
MRRSRRRTFDTPLLTVASLAVLATALAGCFTTAADFASDAETFIEEDDGLRDALFGDSDTTFTSASCVDPENQDEGTRFPCTATDSTGAVWEFEIVITGSNEYEVNVARQPAGS